MKLNNIVILFSLIFFCETAGAQVAVELDDVRGLTRCSFKESKKGDYSYCGDKIKSVFISVSFSKSIPISPNPKSISIDYIFEYISNNYKNLDKEIDEFKYDVSFVPLGKWSRMKKKNYFYVHAKFFPTDGNRIICVLLFDRNGRYETDSFLVDLSKNNYENSFRKELEIISQKLNYELISRRGM